MSTLELLSKLNDLVMPTKDDGLPKNEGAIASPTQTEKQIARFHWGGFTNRADEISGAAFGLINLSQYSMKWFALSLFANSSGGDLVGGDISLGANISGEDTIGAQIAAANITDKDAIGVEIAGTNITGEDAIGMHIAGANIFGGDAIGLQIGGLNLSGKNMFGFQLAAINISGESMYGLQIAGINFSDEDMFGVQLSLANTSLGNMTGLQLANFINKSDGDMTIFRFAGFGNVSGGNIMVMQPVGLWNFSDGNMDMAQLVSGVNITNKDMDGFSGVSLLNISDGNMDGAEIAAFANISGRNMTGFKLGTVNYAKGNAPGVLLGALNIWEDGDCFCPVANLVCLGWDEKNKKISGSAMIGTGYAWIDLNTESSLAQQNNNTIPLGQKVKEYGNTGGGIFNFSLTVSRQDIFRVKGLSITAHAVNGSKVRFNDDLSKAIYNADDQFSLVTASDLTFWGGNLQFSSEKLSSLMFFSGFDLNADNEFQYLKTSYKFGDEISLTPEIGWGSGAAFSTNFIKDSASIGEFGHKLLGSLNFIFPLEEGQGLLGGSVGHNFSEEDSLPEFAFWGGIKHADKDLSTLLNVKHRGTSDSIFRNFSTTAATFGILLLDTLDLKYTYVYTPIPADKWRLPKAWCQYDEDACTLTTENPKHIHRVIGKLKFLDPFYSSYEGLFVPDSVQDHRVMGGVEIL